MDIKSKEERSFNMSKIQAKNTKPELFIRSELHRLGYRFRVNSNLVEGHPDIYFTKKRIAVFVHGCFWHRHAGCRFAYSPKSNVDFWMNKFETNLRRDEFVIKELVSEGIRVLLIWECTVRAMIKDEETYRQKKTEIVNFIEIPDANYKEL